MIAFPSIPLFVGPVELMLIGAVILVILFGSRATDVARDAGSAVGKVRKTRAEAEREITEFKGEIEEGVEPIKEEVEAVEEEVESVEKDVESVERDLESKPGTGGYGPKRSDSGQSDEEN